MDSAAFGGALAEASFRFIEGVNRHLGGERLVWNFVWGEASRLKLMRPLRILDMGSGSCDIPVAVCRRAARAGIALEFVCVEYNSHAVARARRLLSANGDLPITLLHQDIFAHRPGHPYDGAVASMFFHHLGEAAIRELILRLATQVRGRLLINDLGRCWPNYLGAALLALGWPAGVRHDAMVSVKRGFRPAELREMLQRIGVGKFTAGWAWPFRIRAVLDYAG